MSLSPSATLRLPALAIANSSLVTLVSFFVFAPTILFARWLDPLPAIIVVCGCFGAMAILLRRPFGAQLLERPIEPGRLAIALAVAFGLLLLGGEAHLFYATDDWQIRDAVLSDLAKHGLPLYQADHDDYLLRAPLGMYMVPGLVGRGLGLKAAHLALLGQNTLVLGVSLYMLGLIGRGWTNVAVVVLFGGLSIVGAYLAATRSAHDLSFLMRFGLDAWHPYLQYSSTMVQLFWAPNHALPGIWLAILLLLQRSSSPDVAMVSVSAAGLFFWSPLAVLPVAAWLLLAFVQNWRGVLLSRRTWLGVAVCLMFLPIAAFLLLSVATISHTSITDHPDAGFWYGLFVVIQLPVLVFLGIPWQDVPERFRGLVIVNAAVLVVLPMFGFGPNNDLVMRASMLPFTIIAFVFGFMIVELSRRRRRAALVGWVLFAAGTPSAAFEVGRALSTPRYAISDCSLLEAAKASGSKGMPTNYITDMRNVQGWLLDVRRLPRIPTIARSCWPDHVAPRLFGYTFKAAPKP